MESARIPYLLLFLLFSPSFKRSADVEDLCLYVMCGGARAVGQGRATGSPPHPATTLCRVHLLYFYYFTYLPSTVLLIPWAACSLCDSTIMCFCCVFSVFAYEIEKEIKTKYYKNLLNVFSNDFLNDFLKTF